MQLVTPPRHIALAGLRALRTVALADGSLDGLEKELIDAVSTHLLKLDVNIEDLESIGAEELATTVEDDMFRERIMRGLVLVALADADLSQAEEKLLLAYGKALGTPTPTLKTIKHIAHERLKLLRIDILRRSFIGKRLRFQFEQKGMRGMLEAARCIAGHEIPHLRDKYLALENKPIGTLGRAYFDFTREHGFFFPGEPGGAPEPLVFHDCSHVLGGYDTTISEEACVVAFQSGYQNDDPLHSLLFVVAQFHLGMKLSPVAGAERMGIKDMEEVVKCFILGSQCKRDLSDHWDPWVDFDADVSELRERYNIQLRPTESTNTVAT